jgi:large subunit ribosomal protein L9
MRVILLQDVAGLGQRGQVLEVKDGYARNYLMPRGLAEPATAGRVKAREAEIAQQRAKAERELAHARELAQALRDATVTVAVRVGEGGRLFGSVTNGDVADRLAQMGYHVDRKQVRMDPIKTLGTHRVPIHLHEGVNTEITVEVVPR